MAMIELLDQADYLIATHDDPTTLTTNVDIQLAVGTAASSVQMLVMPPDKFFAYIGSTGTPKCTAIGNIPGNPPTGGATQYNIYARTLTYDVHGAPLVVGKFALATTSPVGT